MTVVYMFSLDRHEMLPEQPAKGSLSLCSHQRAGQRSRTCLSRCLRRVWRTRQCNLQHNFLNTKRISVIANKQLVN